LDQCGRRFLTYTAVAVRLAQSVVGTSAINERARSPSNKVLLNRSATPLDCGEYRAVFSCTIPFSSRKFFIAIEMNSPPRSVWSILILHPSFFLMKALNLLKVMKASSLLARKYTKAQREQSSIKVRTYLAPWYIPLA